MVASDISNPHLIQYNEVVKFYLHQKQELPCIPVHQFTWLPKCMATHAFGTQSEGGCRAFSSPAIVFSFLKVSEFCWCDFQEAEVDGKLRIRENRAVPFCSVPSPLHSHELFMLYTFLKHAERVTGDMVGWVSKARKTNSGTGSDTGKDLTSRPWAHRAIMRSGIRLLESISKEWVSFWEQRRSSRRRRQKRFLQSFQLSQSLELLLIFWLMMCINPVMSSPKVSCCTWQQDGMWHLVTSVSLCQ